ncbi:MAG: PHP domain-containing protein, partial [Coprobacillus sp.]
PNDSHYFGHQLVLDAQDEVIEEESRLLIKSLDLSLKEVINAIHHFNGVAVLAHVFNERFSIMHVYMDINEDLDFDGIEITKEYQKDELIGRYPFLEKKVWFINSDAHRLDMISEPIYQIETNQFENLWRKRYG